MIRTNARVPKLGRHASGQAVVRLGGKDHYLGRFGTPDAQAKYDTLIAEWLSRGRTLPQAQDAELSVNELVLAYLRQHVESHYRKNGKATSEQSLIKSALRVLKDAYGLTPVSQFGPLALKVVRQRMGERPPGPVLNLGRLRRFGVRLGGRFFERSGRGDILGWLRDARRPSGRDAEPRSPRSPLSRKATRPEQP